MPPLSSAFDMAALIVVGVLVTVGVLRLLRDQPTPPASMSLPAPDEPIASPMPDASPVVVFETSDASLVPVVSSLLAGADIPFLPRGEGIQDLFAWGRLSGHNPVTGPVQFLVPPDHAASARELLHDLPSEGLPHTTTGIQHNA